MNMMPINKQVKASRKAMAILLINKRAAGWKWSDVLAWRAKYAF